MFCFVLSELNKDSKHSNRREPYPWHYCEEASAGRYCLNTDSTGSQVWWAKGFLDCPYPCPLRGDSAGRRKVKKENKNKYRPLIFPIYHLSSDCEQNHAKTSICRAKTINKTIAKKAKALEEAIIRLGIFNL